MERFFQPQDKMNTEFSVDQTTLDSEITFTTQQDNSNEGRRDADGVWSQAVVVILQMFLIFILCLFGTMINSLVFWVFYRRPALRSLSNRFVLSLVTANILISTIIAPLILFETFIYYYLLLPCISELISMAASTVIYSAIFSTFLIATDRFYAVTSPLHYSMTITRRRSQIMIVFAWLFGAFISLPQLTICFISAKSDLHKNLHIFFTIIQIVLGYLFPFIGLCWLYVKMYNAAHRNSERTRKHSISGELLTIMDGSTSVIPQGIDFLTHYMNPFTKTPMAGSVPPNPAKNKRRRSSNSSSSSLLFREEGRAIKTAFFVLASFFLCWAPHFVCMVLREVESEFNEMGEDYWEWSRFVSVVGMLLSSVLNPFIYVFRNQTACKEVSKLLCRDKNQDESLRESKEMRKTEEKREEEGHGSDEGGENPDPAVVPHFQYKPSLKSPKRSSMKSLTPQNSVNSTRTTCFSTDSPLLLFGKGRFGSGSIEEGQAANGKPPFFRSLTLPEQTQQRVKFPPNLTRQKLCGQHRSVGSGEIPNGSLAKRPKFVRQDSICSIMSNDSVLMICAEDEVPTDPAPTQPPPPNAPIQKDTSLNSRYLRQDSNFSDVSHKTNDSGVVLDMVRNMSRQQQLESLSPEQQGRRKGKIPPLPLTVLQTTI